MDKVQEFELWKSWKKEPSQENLRPLLNAFYPIIKRRMNTFAATGLPETFLEMEAKRLAVDSFKNYNPSKSELSTHLTNNLRRLSRIVGRVQNVGHVPENRIYKISLFKKTRSDLGDELDREPSSLELSERLKWPMAEVSRMENELRGVSISSSLAFDPVSSSSIQREDVVSKMIYHDLNGEEQTVYEYLLGVGGKPVLNVSQIATKLKISPSKVTRIRKKIAEKVKLYY